MPTTSKTERRQGVIAFIAALALSIALVAAFIPAVEVLV